MSGTMRRRRGRRGGRVARGTLGLAGALALALAPGVAGQEPPTPDRIRRLASEPVRFEQPEPERHRIAGVPVLLLEDRSLPLVTVLVGFEGGYAHFPRADYAAGTAMPSLLRYGGARELPPDSVETLIDTYAIQLTFGSGGGSISSSLNTLREHFGTGMELWGRMLSEPAFDSSEVELWRLRQLESLRRRTDDPSVLAFSEFNRLLYGDHPIGWEMEEADLRPEALAPERLEGLHERIVCRDNLLVGITGDIDWREARGPLEAFVARFRPCDEPLPEAPLPDVRRERGVFVIDRPIEQSVIVMAHPTDLPLADDPEYFAATIGNQVLGAGGFSSRIMARVRTQEGFAYGASSLWTTPRRYEGLLGAVTRTRPENVVDAVRVILETMRDLRDHPPLEQEVEIAIDRIVNGFVFNFDSPAQIVSRTMFYLAQDLPDDWLERYLDGIQDVDAGDVGRVFAEHLRPDEMTILVVGDVARIGEEALRSLGPLTRLELPPRVGADAGGGAAADPGAEGAAASDTGDAATPAAPATGTEAGERPVAAPDTVPSTGVRPYPNAAPRSRR